MGKKIGGEGDVTVYKGVVPEGGPLVMWAPGQGPMLSLMQGVWWV